MQVTISHIDVIGRDKLEGGVAKDQGSISFGERFFKFLDPDIHQRHIQEAFSPG